MRDLLEGATQGGPSVPWFGLWKAMQTLFASGYTGTVVTAKLTGGGTNGSLTFRNGVVVAQVEPT